VYHIEKSEILDKTGKGLTPYAPSFTEEIRSIESIRGVFSCASGDREWDPHDVLVPANRTSVKGLGTPTPASSSSVPKLQLLNSKSTPALEDHQLGLKSVQKSCDVGAIAHDAYFEHRQTVTDTDTGAEIEKSSRVSKLSRRLKSARDELFFVDND